MITLCGEPTLVKEERVDRMEGARGGVMEHGEEAAPFSEDTRALIRGHGGRTGGSTFCPSESRAAGSVIRLDNPFSAQRGTPSRSVEG